MSVMAMFSITSALWLGRQDVNDGDVLNNVSDGDVLNNLDVVARETRCQ